MNQMNTTTSNTILYNQIQSSSSQNSWNGETCQETTFNWTQTTSCLNDCFEIWGQGQCNQITGQCECTSYYTGQDCSINIDIEHDWDVMDCNGGRYCPPVYGTTQARHCICPPGQEGLECNICSTSSSCNALMNDQLNSYTCDNSPYVEIQKNYSCIVTSQEVNGDLNNSTASTSIDCNFSDSNSNGECSMDFYYHETGTPLYFNCSFYQCERSYSSNGGQNISCQYSACNCTTYCGFFLNGVISQVSGPAQFNCDSIISSSNRFNCTFSQQEMALILPTIPLSCVAGECLDSSAPSPTPSPSTLPQETCQQTTFNWTQTTSCLNDCFEIWGQGQCNQITGQCECTSYYTGQDCSINIDIEHDWDVMDCNGGRYCPPIYEANQYRHCVCPPGQEGLECNICSTSSSCNALMNDPLNSYTCDSSLIVYNQKNYSCMVSNNQYSNLFINSSASYSCEFENNQYDSQSGKCSMNMYNSLTGAPLLFNCSFDECDRDVTNGYQTISCQKSSCSCTSYCSMILESFISQVQNAAKFMCSQSSPSSKSNCSFTQVEFSELIPNVQLQCDASECLNNNIPL